MQTTLTSLSSQTPTIWRPHTHLQHLYPTAEDKDEGMGAELGEDGCAQGVPTCRQLGRARQQQAGATSQV